jgi:hypothetical protein
MFEEREYETISGMLADWVAVTFPLFLVQSEV